MESATRASALEFSHAGAEQAPVFAPQQDQRLTVLDGRFLPLATLRSLLPQLEMAIPIEVVRALTGLSDSTVWSKCDEDKDTFDPEFPQPRRYPGLKRTVWSLVEVQGYLRKLFDQPKRERAETTLGRPENACGRNAITPVRRQPARSRHADRARSVNQ
jgi:predicted DNA-binding transcriptional regulator AlpA